MLVDITCGNLKFMVDELPLVHCEYQSTNLIHIDHLPRVNSCNTCSTVAARLSPLVSESAKKLATDRHPKAKPGGKKVISHDVYTSQFFWDEQLSERMM
jgi:hypothetical protein